MLLNIQIYNNKLNFYNNEAFSCSRIVDEEMENTRFLNSEKSRDIIGLWMWLKIVRSFIIMGK